MARLGARVTGIDAAERNIAEDALRHQPLAIPGHAARGLEPARDLDRVAIGERLEVLGADLERAVDVAQHRSATRDNDDRLALKPVAHLRERVPDVGVIKPCKTMHDAR